MRHHGAVTTGRTLSEAWVRYYYLDRICRVQCEAAAAGGSCLQPSKALLAHAAEQIRTDWPFGKYEWGMLTRLGENKLDERARRLLGARLLPTDVVTALQGAPLPPRPRVSASAAAAVHAIETVGFAVVGGVIPDEVVGAVRESVYQSTRTHRNPNAPPTIGHVPGLLVHNQSFAPFLSSRKVMDIVESIFGTGAKITFTTGQTNYPGCERQEWHADWPFAQTGSAHIPAPYADACCHLTCACRHPPSGLPRGA